MLRYLTFLKQQEQHLIHVKGKVIGNNADSNKGYSCSCLSGKLLNGVSVSFV